MGFRCSKCKAYFWQPCAAPVKCRRCGSAACALAIGLALFHAHDAPHVHMETDVSQDYRPIQAQLSGVDTVTNSGARWNVSAAG